VSRQEPEAWEVLVACQGQLRLAPSVHVIGIDVNAALKIDAASVLHDRDPGSRPATSSMIWAVQFTPRARDTVLQSCAAFDSVSSPARCPKNSTL
jgi:hypothetical protein